MKIENMSNGKSKLTIQNFIGGHFEEASEFLDSLDPATGQTWARIPDSNESDVDKAVASAKSAFAIWKSYSVEKRAEFLLNAATLLESRLDEFALAESRDQVSIFSHLLGPKGQDFILRCYSDSRIRAPRPRIRPE
jgi:acyl-CoA reductase-like NAD-dependent aldehyde dehydrogenase